MKIKPKYSNDDVVMADFPITKDALLILKAFSEYSKYDMPDLMYKISKELAQDKDFLDFIEHKRSNKKLKSIIAKYKDVTFEELIESDENNER